MYLLRCAFMDAPASDPSRPALNFWASSRLARAFGVVGSRGALCSSGQSHCVWRASRSSGSSIRGMIAIRKLYYRVFFKEALEPGGAFVIKDTKSQQIIGSTRFYGYALENLRSKLDGHFWRESIGAADTTRKRNNYC